jgi:hypothetical protein
MKTIALLSSLAVALSLAGCGGGKAPEEQADAGDHALLDAAREPLEKAHEVEDVSAGRKAQLDEEIDQADR